ncbi:MAG TPA: DNA translocase FtsK [Candidatus Pacebacteria bacterium]|nr:DNA translocase FtsK [Candidatus Paceibacterota bacterium]
MLSFTGQGQVLKVINGFLIQKIGLAALFLPFLSMASGLVLFRTKWAWSKPHVLLGGVLLFLSLLGLFQTGEIGVQTFYNLAQLLSIPGTYGLFAAIGVSGGLILTQLSWKEVVETTENWRRNNLNLGTKKSASFIEQAESETGSKGLNFSIPKLNLPFGAKSAVESAALAEALKPDLTTKFAPNSSVDAQFDKKLIKLPVGDGSLSGANPVEATQKPALAENHFEVPPVWEYPPLSLLSDKGGGRADRGDIKSNAQIIENTLDSFGIRAQVSEVNKGPAVTQYALKITQGTKISKITSLATDLALALAAPTGQVRIEAPIAGKSLVGVEVPNHSAQYVTLREMLADNAMKQHKSKLAVALGIGVSGEKVVADISKMPHLLIAGSTGSGKSVAVNAFLCSILFRASPEEVKLILVDPKRVELSGYNDIPHLMTPVIVEPNKVVSALKWATNEMDKRYKQLAEVRVRNISEYNELAGLAAMPNIIIVIDELADIMLFAPTEVEESVTRIAQMARAVGIHLVLATQRPSVDVITGLIKANIPTRIAFNVSSVTDSRVILDSPGAEKLLGRGDMLYLPPDRAKPLRVQGTFVNDREIHALIDFLKSQGRKPNYQEDVTTKFKSTLTRGSVNVGGADGNTNHDGLFIEAARLFSKYDKASSSLIQRKLSVGYARAARILDQLYEAGMVGPDNGSKPRDVNSGKIAEYMSSLQNLEES